MAPWLHGSIAMTLSVGCDSEYPAPDTMPSATSGSAGAGNNDAGNNDSGNSDSADGTAGSNDGTTGAADVEVPWLCICTFDCDGVEDIWDADVVCATEEEAEILVDVASDACIAEFEPVCDTLECACECEVDTDFSCE